MYVRKRELINVYNCLKSLTFGVMCYIETGYIAMEEEMWEQREAASCGGVSPAPTLGRQGLPSSGPPTPVCPETPPSQPQPSQQGCSSQQLAPWGREPRREPGVGETQQQVWEENRSETARLTSGAYYVPPQSGGFRIGFHSVLTRASVAEYCPHSLE